MKISTQYLLDRAKEPSTWRGLVLIITSCGIAIGPEQIEAISFAGLFVAGLIGAATKDQPK